MARKKQPVSTGRAEITKTQESQTTDATSKMTSRKLRLFKENIGTVEKQKSRSKPVASPATLPKTRKKTKKAPKVPDNDCQTDNSDIGNTRENQSKDNGGRVGKKKPKSKRMSNSSPLKSSKIGKKSKKAHRITATDTGSENDTSETRIQKQSKGKGALIGTKKSNKSNGPPVTTSSPAKLTKARKESQKMSITSDSGGDISNSTVNKVTSKRKRLMASCSESEEDVQTKSKKRKSSDSANVRSKSHEKIKTKASKRKETAQLSKRTVSPTNKLTRETYNATVSPQKGKRSRSPKRRVGWEYQRDVHVSETIHKKWRMPTPPEKEFLMNVVDTYMSAILNKTSSRRYNMVLEHLNLLKARLWKTLSKESVPDSDHISWQEMDSALLDLSAQIETIAEQQELVNKATEQLTLDLDQLEQQRNCYEEAAEQDRPTVMAMEFTALQRVLQVKDSTEVRLLCIGESNNNVPEPRNAELEEENDKLIDRLAMLYENDNP